MKSRHARPTGVHREDAQSPPAVTEPEAPTDDTLLRRRYLLRSSQQDKPPILGGAARRSSRPTDAPRIGNQSHRFFVRPPGRYGHRARRIPAQAGTETESQSSIEAAKAMRPTAIEWSSGFPSDGASDLAASPTQPPNRTKWPSAKEILATHRNRTTARGDAGAGRARVTKSCANAGTRARPMVAAGLGRRPTGGRALSWPSDWRPCALSWWWADDSYSASIMTARLLAADRTGQRGPLPGIVAPPDRHRGFVPPRSTWRTGRSS